MASLLPILLAIADSLSLVHVPNSRSMIVATSGHTFPLLCISLVRDVKFSGEFHLNVVEQSLPKAFCIGHLPIGKIFAFLQSIVNSPKPIQKAMEDWCKNYAGHIEYLGVYQGGDAYTYDFENDDLEIGFPVVYLLNSDNTVEEIGGLEGLEICNSFVEDVDEVGVE